MLIDELRKRQDMLKKLISRITKKPQPESGSIRVTSSHGNVQYMYRNGGEERYLRISETVLAREIVQNEYDRAVLKAVSRQLKAVDGLISVLGKTDIFSIYDKMPPGKKELISPYIESTDEYVKKWLSEPYQRKGFNDGDPEYYNAVGERMRSKSECMISDLLRELGIPYKYEYPVKLRGYGTVYVDFLLLNTTTRDEFYYEHFGMVDDPKYAKTMFDRLGAFISSGIIPGKKLIFSFERSDSPVDLRQVKKILTGFCLTEP
ncbi:MAG: hypothetical protein IJS22_03080 [Lachnospiraceae bacterium]|nr:hypothetical protein [Lachnospiraceae bacterium]